MKLQNSSRHAGKAFLLRKWPLKVPDMWLPVAKLASGHFALCVSAMPTKRASLQSASAERQRILFETLK